MSKFTLDTDSRKVVLLVLFVGLGFNIATFFTFRMRSQNQLTELRKNLDSVYDDKYKSLKNDIDNFLQFVTTNKVVSSSSALNSNLARSSEVSNTPILPVVDSIDFDYFIHEGKHIAKIGGQYFSSGSPFPHGGTITRVYPDSIIIDGKFRVSRSSVASVRSPSSTVSPSSTFSPSVSSSSSSSSRFNDSSYYGFSSTN